MSLTDTIEGVIEDFNKRKNPSEIWKTLEKKLKEFGLRKKYDEVVNSTDSLGAYNLLKVLDALDEHLRSKNNPWHSKTEFKVIKTISELECIEEVIKTLGESGYKPTIKDTFTFAYLPEESLKIFEILAKEGLYKKYGLASKLLKKLGHKGVSRYAKSQHSFDMIQFDHLVNIARLEGDITGAICILANKGYKIDEAKGLNKLDFDSIKKITEEDEKEKAEGKGGIPLYLYDTGSIEIFQEYFNSLEAENKKSVLKSILDYEIRSGEDRLVEPSNKRQNRKWLEKDYESLLREVGFEG